MYGAPQGLVLGPFYTLLCFKCIKSLPFRWFPVHFLYIFLLQHKVGNLSVVFDQAFIVIVLMLNLASCSLFSQKHLETVISFVEQFTEKIKKKYKLLKWSIRLQNMTNSIFPKSHLQMGWRILIQLCFFTYKLSKMNEIASKMWAWYENSNLILLSQFNKYMNNPVADLVTLSGVALLTIHFKANFFQQKTSITLLECKVLLRNPWWMPHQHFVTFFWQFLCSFCVFSLSFMGTRYHWSYKGAADGSCQAASIYKGNLNCFAVCKVTSR